jgi:aminopeptidase N
MKSLLKSLLLILVISGCATQKVKENAYENSISLDTISISANQTTAYHASETRSFDLLHTKLDVRFDWEKQYLNGKAELLITPWFYATNKLILDAKGFDLHVVALQNSAGVKELKYDYDGLAISIELDSVYSRTDTFTVYIEYTAKPNELANVGSAAITGDKGLYFIDPLDEDPEKPSQIWTQGETEASSCWFPTIDIPNEKMTQEISITVQEKYLTLSNGELFYQKENGNGTRTDVWVMRKQHAPYLAMMAIGEFSITEDTWRDSISVNYYVEQAYAPYAMQIFGKTPEMLECFSNALGVDYPWNKYHQIVVRDYVSGAMENTSAVIHGGFVQQTAREMIDEDNEDIISHELFHHWFGDLVTCESWSNLPLNESFATYGEYIWREYKYGRESADYHLQGMLSEYIRASQGSQENIIRFYYDEKDDMFDSHSYAKGGRILHMLRKEVGDEAFYASLELYLNKHAYKTVEIHDLRIAFEETTGRDLNWFFNQWFLSSGHPDLLIKYDYVDSIKTQRVIVEQKQNREETPVYRIPLVVDLYVGGGVQHESILITERYHEFSFRVSEQPNLVNVDAEKMLVCVKNDKKSTKEWAFQYKNAPLYLDRFEAIEALGKIARKDSLAASIILASLDDPAWSLRSLAIENLEPIVSSYETQIKSDLIEIAASDSKSSVRAKAIELLADEFKSDDLKELFIQGTKDSSYVVLEESLSALTTLDNSLGLDYCKRFENEKNEGVLESICYIYSSYGDDSHHPFFVTSAKKIKGYTRISFLNDYEYYLAGDRTLSVVSQGVDVILDMGVGGENEYVSMFAKHALENLKNDYKKREHELNKKMSELGSTDNTSQSLVLSMEAEQKQLKQLVVKISSAYDAVTNHLK